MLLEDDIAQSREFEMKTYLNSLKSLYENAISQNDDLYDIAFDLTKGFSNITEVPILADSRIIKILRYAIAPSISQMKFGQFFGLTSVDAFETSKLTPRSRRYKTLERIAGRIADFVTQHLDKGRFIWLVGDEKTSELALSYAKKWTCSIAADQNAQTAYRNWRKELQEQAVISRLISMGYVRSRFSGIIENYTDIEIGEYTKEIKVRGRTIQKADVVFRSKVTKHLVLLEAKAVGVEIDATKRIKECCDKANDWSSVPSLQSPDIVTVIAGFFSHTNIASLNASNIRVVWEHRLDDLEGIA